MTSLFLWLPRLTCFSYTLNYYFFFLVAANTIRAMMTAAGMPMIRARLPPEMVEEVSLMK